MEKPQIFTFLNWPMPPDFIKSIAEWKWVPPLLLTQPVRRDCIFRAALTMVRHSPNGISHRFFGHRHLCPPGMYTSSRQCQWIRRSDHHCIDIYLYFRVIFWKSLTQWGAFPCFLVTESPYRLRTAVSISSNHGAFLRWESSGHCSCHRFPRHHCIQ